MTQAEAEKLALQFHEEICPIQEFGSLSAAQKAMEKTPADLRYGIVQGEGTNVGRFVLVFFEDKPAALPLAKG